jgi:hypothetical protein
MGRRERRTRVTVWFDSEVVRDSLLAAFNGTEPPADLLQQVGGWPAVGALTEHLVDHPLLGPVVSLACREATLRGTDSDDARTACVALAAAVTASTDPLLFSHSLDELCNTPDILATVGSEIAAACLVLAGPPEAAEEATPTTPEVSRRADALETYVRLALAGHASEYKLLALLEDVTEPQPRRYAQAVVRAIGTSYDHWDVDDRIVGVIDILTGVATPAYATTPDVATTLRSREYARDITSDASWAHANIELVRAFRSASPAETSDYIGRALEALAPAKDGDDREDAALLHSALTLLRDFLIGRNTAGAGPSPGEDWNLDLLEVENLERRADQFALTSRGLNHWSGDRKRAVIEGWKRLADDLAWLKEKLERDSLYDAAVVLDDLIQIYSATHSYDLTRRRDGIETIHAIVRPAVAGGFAARAGLMRNLEDHIVALQAEVSGFDAADVNAAGVRDQLAAAQALRDAARAHLRSAPEPPGKPPAQEAELPPLLAEFIGPYAGVADALAAFAPEVLHGLAAKLADRQAANALEPDLVVSEIRREMLAALVASPDFRDEVAPAVETVLGLLLRFADRCMNAQKSNRAYLFSADANEDDLHKDLYDWLKASELSRMTNIEVQEVGGGRADIQITFSGFHLYLELKADDTMVPVAGKSAYIKQTVTYQATDVRIGFLVVLRLAPPRDKSPAPHLHDYVSHTTVDVPGSNGERHVVMVEIPGNRTAPSSVR